MTGWDDREETRRIADLYQVTRQPGEAHGPLWPRLKLGAEAWGIGAMMQSMFRTLWPF